MLITHEEWFYSPAETTKAREVKALYSLTANSGEDNDPDLDRLSLAVFQLCNREETN